MTPQERAGMAAAITEAIERGCAAERAHFTHELESLHRAADESIAQVQRDLEATRRDLETTRALAEAPPLRDALIDAAGSLRLVQRNGDTLAASLVDLPAVVKLVVHAAIAEARESMRAELLSEIARGMQRLGDAPAWSSAAAYTAGAVVSMYNGRTYVLRDGIKASIGNEPGDSPHLWERIGSHGLRILKSKPEAPEPGDVFADDESRFITDGTTTALLVAKGVKQSDVDRKIKTLEAQIVAIRRERVA